MSKLGSEIILEMTGKQIVAIERYFDGVKKCRICETKINGKEPCLLMTQPRITCAFPDGGKIKVTSVCKNCHDEIFQTIRKLLVKP